MSNFNELMIMADKINRSSIVPENLRAPHELLSAMIFIQELGLPLMAGLQNIAVINGKPTLNSHLLWALVMKQKDLKKVSVSSDNLKATVKIERSLGNFEASFTVEDAKKAGLFEKKGGAWNTYPRQMLEARAKSLCARLAYPEALFGIYSSEEMRDAQNEKEEPIVVEPTINNDFEILEGKKKAFLAKLDKLKEEGELDEDQHFYFAKEFNQCGNEDCLVRKGLELKKVLEENRAFSEKIKEEALKAQNNEVFEVSEEEFSQIEKQGNTALGLNVEEKQDTSKWDEA